jgi:hypothetical protein
MSTVVPECSDEELSVIVDAMNTAGYAVLPQYIRPDQLNRMRSFAVSAVKASKGEYISLTGPDTVLGSGLDELASSLTFRRLLQRIYACGTGLTPPRQDIYLVLRCLKGQSGKPHSGIFHFDSYLVTALIPLAIPSEGMAGDLIMFPNTRRVRSRYIWNVIDKVLLDNPVSQWTLRVIARSGLIEMVRIPMVPGNIYFFWGYRSVHTNEPCDPDKLRATALFHYANPHLGSRLWRRSLTALLSPYAERGSWLK